MTAKWVDGYGMLTDEYDSLEVAWHVDNVPVVFDKETLDYRGGKEAKALCPTWGTKCPDLNNFKKCPADIKFIDSTLSCDSKCSNRNGLATRAITGTTTCAQLDCKKISHYHGDYDSYNWKPKLSENDVVIMKSMNNNKHEVHYKANGLLNQNGGKWNLDQLQDGPFADGWDKDDSKFLKAGGACVVYSVTLPLGMKAKGYVMGGAWNDNEMYKDKNRVVTFPRGIETFCAAPNNSPCAFEFKRVA
jgi:hypothetical protein